MQDAIVAELKRQHEAYVALYSALTDVDSPGKKEWAGQFDLDVHADTVSELLEPVREFALETDDAGELLALFESLLALKNDVAQWINSMYYAATSKLNEAPTGTAEDLEKMLKSIRETLESAVSMANTTGLMDAAAIYGAVPTKMREVRGGGKKRVYNPPGVIRVKMRGQRRMGKASKWVQLVVDGTVHDKTPLGESCRKAGFTVEKLMETLKVAGFENWTDTSKFSTDMAAIEVNGLPKRVGLKLK